jgi:hypothetical protein
MKLLDNLWIDGRIFFVLVLVVVLVLERPGYAWRILAHRCRKAF